MCEEPKNASRTRTPVVGSLSSPSMRFVEGGLGCVYTPLPCIPRRIRRSMSSMRPFVKIHASCVPHFAEMSQRDHCVAVRGVIECEKEGMKIKKRGLQFTI